MWCCVGSLGRVGVGGDSGENPVRFGGRIGARLTARCRQLPTGVQYAGVFKDNKKHGKGVEILPVSGGLKKGWVGK